MAVTPNSTVLIWLSYHEFSSRKNLVQKMLSMYLPHSKISWLCGILMQISGRLIDRTSSIFKYSFFLLSRNSFSLTPHLSLPQQCSFLHISEKVTWIFKSLLKINKIGQKDSIAGKVKRSVFSKLMHQRHIFCLFTWEYYFE